MIRALRYLAQFLAIQGTLCALVALALFVLNK